jgi:hypothetical protein
MGGTCSTNAGAEECLEHMGGKFRRKDITRKTKTYVDGQY